MIWINKIELQSAQNIESSTPRQILSKFYAENNLGQDGGENLSSVKIQVTPKFYFFIPNFNARRKAVLKHDMHHLLTGYETTVKGESEISMWEIASGCKKYFAAFLIDTSGAMLGIFTNYWGLLKAFARGRRTRNLYHDVFSNNAALDMKVSELRKHLLLDIYSINTKPAFSDFILFSLFLIYASVFSIASFALLPFVVFYTLYIVLKNKAAGS